MNQPKLLTLTTPLVRSQRTLIWLQQQTNSFEKWDGVVTSLADYHTWYDERNARIVGMILTDVVGDVEEWLTELYTIAKDVTVLFLSHSIMQLKSEDYWADNYDNVIVLDTIEQAYPFLGEPWNETIEDAIVLFAHLLRYQRLVDCGSVPRTASIEPPMEIKQNIVPERAWLITQYFRSSDMDRRAEIKETLQRNCACAELERIMLLTESDLSKDWKKMSGAEKITQIIIHKRLTYAHFLQFVHDEVPVGIYAILANADIYFDSTLLELWKLDMKDKAIALLRWDDNGSEPVLFGPRADSQDSWILLSDSVKERTWPYATFDFQLGQAGCDNAFAAHLLRNRFSIFNPCLAIKTGHLHASNVRTYSTRDTIRSDLYLNLAPTHILSTKQETIPAPLPQCVCNQLVSFEVKSSSLSNEITYCTMLEKEGRYKWEAQVENHYFEPAIPVYYWQHAGVTQNGLVFKPYSIYVGKHADQYSYWEGATMDILTPLQRCETMLALPFENSTVFQNKDTYLLEYLSRAIRLLNEFPKLTFWCPPEYDDLVDSFSIKEHRRLPWSHQSACWANNVIGMVPGPSSRELGHEDIQALRGAYPAWKRSPTKQRCVVIADDVLTSEFITNKIAPFLKGIDSEWIVDIQTSDQTYHNLVGVSLCIVMGDQPSRWSPLWALPTDGCVIEFQQELSLHGECQHLCHVSDLKSWILILSKAKTEMVQMQIMVHLEKWFKKNGGEILCIS
jgi:hypothetical protein